LLFPADDVEALAAAFTRAFAAPELWAPARTRNADLVRTRADRDTNLDVLGTHYERLVTETDRRRRGVPMPAGDAQSLARAGGAV
jgi:hypothetical protein